MAFCPNCRRDSFIKRQYTNYQTPIRVKVFWACLKCGFTEEGYWTTPMELQEAAQRRAESDEDTESDEDE